MKLVKLFTWSHFRAATFMVVANQSPYLSLLRVSAVVYAFTELLNTRYAMMMKVDKKPFSVPENHGSIITVWNIRTVADHNRVCVAMTLKVSLSPPIENINLNYVMCLSWTVLCFVLCVASSRPPMLLVKINEPNLQQSLLFRSCYYSSVAIGHGLVTLSNNAEIIFVIIIISHIIIWRQVFSNGSILQQNGTRKFNVQAQIRLMKLRFVFYYRREFNWVLTAICDSEFICPLNFKANR